MADVQIHDDATVAAPKQYVVPGSSSFILKAVNATWDGTGAAGSFLPVVEIISDSGELVARAQVGSAVASGNTAQVSFFPFSRGVTATSGGGLQYDVDNMGDWFYAEANAANDQSGAAWEFVDDGAGGFGIYLHSTNGPVLLEGAGRSHFFSALRLLLECTGGPIEIYGTNGDGAVPTAVYLNTPDGELIRSEAGSLANLARLDVIGGTASDGKIQGFATEVLFNLNAGTGAGTNAFVVTDSVSPQFEARKDGNVFMPHLPTSDPGTHDGRIWSNSGVLTLTS